MKRCNRCNKEFDAEENVCPICGSKLQEETDKEEPGADVIVSTMTWTGIL